MAMDLLQDRLDPPFNERPVDETGSAQSRPWQKHTQLVADRLANMPAAVRKGVTDGSDAAAGDIGEYLSASASGVPLTSNVPCDVTTLALTAGDWDVRGDADVATSAGVTQALIWIGTAPTTIATQGSSGMIIGGVTTVFAPHFPAGPVRVSLAAPGTVYLGTRVVFASGTVSASGTISARRMR